MPFDFDLLAIGSGPAGQRAAVQAAKLGKRAAIVEQQAGIGGVCLESGTIPSKTFREAVITVTSAAESLGRQGLVRTILSVNEAEQSITFAGDMPEGSYAR